MVLRCPYFAPFITDPTASTENTSHSCPRQDGPFIMKTEARSNSLSSAHADGPYFEKMDRFKTVKLLIVDDFMATPISTQDAVDLFEIMEAREVSIGAIRHFAMALAISRMSLLALSSSVLSIVKIAPLKSKVTIKHK